MYSKTFLEIKYRHLAVFDWTIEHSLSCFSECVFALNFLGGDAHFLYAIGGRTTPKQPITVAATMNFAFLQILLLSSGVIWGWLLFAPSVYSTFLVSRKMASNYI